MQASILTDSRSERKALELPLASTIGHEKGGKENRSFGIYLFICAQNPIKEGENNHEPPPTPSSASCSAATISTVTCWKPTWRFSLLPWQTSLWQTVCLSETIPAPSCCRNKADASNKCCKFGDLLCRRAEPVAQLSFVRSQGEVRAHSHPMDRDHHHHPCTALPGFHQTQHQGSGRKAELSRPVHFRTLFQKARRDVAEGI